MSLGLTGFSACRPPPAARWGQPHHEYHAPHLIHPGGDFAAVDRLITAGKLAEIPAKRLPHKRGLRFGGVLVEIFLITRDRDGWYTMFWDQVRHDWPTDILGMRDGQRVASAAALRSYRAAHPRLHAGDPTRSAAASCGSAAGLASRRA